MDTSFRPHTVYLHLLAFTVRTSLQIRWYLSGRNMTPQEETGRESQSLGHAIMHDAYSGKAGTVIAMIIYIYIYIYIYISVRVLFSYFFLL
jgi:hypothetical protein